MTAGATGNPTRPGAATEGHHVAVVIFAHDDELHIGPCIRSCKWWCNEVHLLDLGSTDKTAQIAADLGVRVHTVAVEERERARDLAAKLVPGRPWQFHIRADERFTPALVAEMRQRLGPRGAGEGYDAFHCPGAVLMMGRWLRRSVAPDESDVRLLKTGNCRFNVNRDGERAQCRGRVGVLRESLTRHAFAPSLAAWFHRANRETSGELRGAPGSTRPRPGWARTFVRRYFLRGGFLEGLVGLRCCVMLASVAYWRHLKAIERDKPWSEKTEALVREMLSGKVGSQSDKAKIDVFIPTLNESSHIVETVENARLTGPAFVLDSLSTDGTQELARGAGATVVEHRFEGYARQKNWGLDHLPMTGDWVFILDADERITPELREELARMAADPKSGDGYFVNRVVIFMGRAIRYGGWYPSWNMRFFRRGKARYEDRSVHEHMICPGPTGYLRHEMLHIRREPVHEWVRKHIRYAELESDEWVKLHSGKQAGANPQLLSRDILRYRWYLRREVWPRLPARGLLRFIYMYIFRLGVLDGAPGWRLAIFMGAYENMIAQMLREKMYRLRSRGLGIEPEVPADAPREALARSPHEPGQ